MPELRLESDRFTCPADIEEAVRFFYSQGLTDGLPIIPPTEERVRRMLSGTSRNPDEMLGQMPPDCADVTVEKVAINGVMAGCLPQYMPVLIAAVEATLATSNLHTQIATTYPSSFLTVVNGPVRKELEINCGHGAFGPGAQSNATIGRALRLVIRNVGGAIPGVVAMTTQGGPQQYPYCIGENEEENPWEPYHVEQGFDPQASTVTVFVGEGPHNINDVEGTNAEHILTIAADTMVTLGMNQVSWPTGAFLALCPEHAATIANQGWTKEDVKKFLFMTASMTLKKRRFAGMFSHRLGWPKWWEVADEETPIPLVLDWRDIVVVVVGGVGPHSSCVPRKTAHIITREIKSSDESRVGRSQESSINQVVK